MNLSRILFICLATLCSLSTIPGFSQKARPSFEMGVRAGYDYPLFNTPYQQLTYQGGRYLGVQADYHFPSNLGIRLNYSNIITRPNILIPDIIHFGPSPSPTTKSLLNIQRHTLALGPSYLFNFGQSRFTILVAPMAAYSWISGGDALVKSVNPDTSLDEIQMLNTGFKDKVISTKMDIDFSYAISDNFKVNLGLYYLRHFEVNLDNRLDINPPGGTLSIVHGENAYDQLPNPYTISTTDPPYVVDQKGEEGCCMGLSSVGANVGISYRFGRKPKPPCTTCNTCPDDDHKVVVTVRDDLSKKVIPNSDVAIKDMSGNVIATGTTNSFGVVDFGEIYHGDYIVTGQVYDIPTTTTSLLDAEFLPNAIIQKEILYTDVRFILKGKVINKGSRSPEPNVVVTLTDRNIGDVKQDNSKGQGEFTFRLEKNSSYEVVGVKEKRLSDIERVTTVGLTRSTTLFVDLELGVDDFECGTGTVLDIKYALDKWYLTDAAKFELDRLIRYLNDHHYDRVELGSHTDCRGSFTYNQELSEKRAKSAVDYIVSKGIPFNRITARGYGEGAPLNYCSDCDQCTEQQHAENRRTEAKLLCN